jgi:tetratricopeptide (TPR) repeat protein
MELVRGIPITEFCDKARLSIRERLELFATVCRAVQHAHQKGIIHRDLKPTNILVTLHDGTPVPKVIDFGVAKAMHEPLTERTLHTGFCQMLGTPAYMSPEQAALSGLDIDTRSDVYSLGVLLYELLTGSPPFDNNTLKKAGYDEFRRLIREVEPPIPSSRLSTLNAEAISTVADHRASEPRKLGQLLLGELDWLVMKALEKDRNRRYESASALAADVERYLADEPVEACPPSSIYRARKYLRRHKGPIAAAALVLLTLVGGIIGTTWQAIRATAAQRESSFNEKQAKLAQHDAATESAIARAVNEFLQRDLLGHAASAPQPAREFGGEHYLTVREALHRAAARIDQRFQDQPLVEAAIRAAIGEAYNSLTDNKSAAPHLERALALRTAHLGPDHVDTLSSMHSLADAYNGAGRHAETLALRRRLLLNRTAVLGPDHPETIDCARRLAAAYGYAGEFETSAPLWEQLLAKHLVLRGPKHVDTASAMHHLAIDYMCLDRLPESLALFEKVLEIYKSTLGPTDAGTTWCMLCFAQACQQAGKLDQAESLLREALEQIRKRDDSTGRRGATANALGWLARTLLLKKQYTAAEPLAREAAAIFEKERPDDQRRFYWMSLLGGVMLAQQKYAEAEPLLLQGYEGMNQRAPGSVRRVRLPEVGERVVRFYEATNQPEKARIWREKLQQAKKEHDQARKGN